MQKKFDKTFGSAIAMNKVLISFIDNLNISELKDRLLQSGFETAEEILNL